MPMLVKVRALKSFEHEGIYFNVGDPISMPAVTAAILSRQGLVNLSKQTIQTRELTPEPDPVPVPVRRRRSYKRADMTAETTE